MDIRMVRGSYVVHFLAIAATYERALFLAKTIDGKKYNKNDFGGGIVFHSATDKKRLEDEILKVSETRVKGD